MKSIFLLVLLSHPVSEHCLEQVYGQHASRKFADFLLISLGLTLSLRPKKLSNGIEHVVCLWMAFVISKYLVQAMFFEYGGVLFCWNFEMFPMPSVVSEYQILSLCFFRHRNLCSCMFQAHCLPSQQKKDKHVVSGLWFMKPYKSDFMKPIHFIVEHIFFFRGDGKKSWEIWVRVKGLNGVTEAFFYKNFDWKSSYNEKETL